MEISAGTLLGRYEILQQIGAGGMGKVYLARDTKLERSVALKILPPDFASDIRRMNRFIQEAKAASALNHPNILTIHEVEQINATHFIATEFIDGITLRQCIAAIPMRLVEALDVATQIASALSAAHATGIVHRDIKPDNVMVRHDGIVKLLDFGLAKVTERPTTTDAEAPTMAQVNTDAGTIMGTVKYMSPEQTRGLSVDAHTDLWSLGVVLYEMVTGRVPFEGATASDVVASILEKEPPPLARYARGVPIELEWIVTKALTKDKDERYQTAREMLVDLRRLKQRMDVEAEIERTHTPETDGSGATSANDLGAAVTVERPAPDSTYPGPTHPTSSAEYIITELKRHRGGALLVLAVLAAGLAAAVAYYTHFRGSSPAITSVAVLPFANTGGNSETEYLSDGISEGLINSLSQLPQLKVIARSSSFKYKGKEVDPQEVARALGVQAVVSGRVLLRGDQLQVSAEMVDVREGTQLWGEQYNRRVSDLLEVQGEISREIADNLRLRLNKSEQQHLGRRETANPQAYELMLKGRYASNKGGTEEQRKALEYLNEALAIDPAYADAYAELAQTYWRLVGGGNLSPKDGVPKAEQAARKALELDEKLAEAHIATANIKLNAWDLEGAEREYRRAIELNPNLAVAYQQYAAYLSLIEQHDKAVEQIRRAKELDPISTTVNNGVGYVLYLARQYDEAIEGLRKTLELDRTDPYTHVYLGYNYAANKMYTEAIAEYQEAVRLGDESPSTQIYLGTAYANAGQRGQAEVILKRLETGKEYVSPGELAVLYIALGRLDEAFASLERAFEIRDIQLLFLRTDQSFDRIREDPRFVDLIRRVGLPQ